MIAFRSILLAGCAAVALIATSPRADADDALPAAVKQQIDAGVSAWSATGNMTALSAAVADLCNQNPGVALDIVAYAGEAAARAETSDHCLVSNSTCTALDELMAVLYDQTLQVGGRASMAAVTPSSGGTTLPAATPVVTPPASSGSSSGSPPARDANVPHGGEPPLPCQASGTCGGEGPPASFTAL